MNFSNPPPAEICHLLRAVQTIAVVGLSANTARPSFHVAQALQRYGYRILPVHPVAGNVLGELTYADLSQLPFLPDIVEVFRAPEHVPAIVTGCIELGIKNLWLQDGVVNEAAALTAQQAGMTVIMNRCMLRDRSQLCEDPMLFSLEKSPFALSVSKGSDCEASGSTSSPRTVK